MSFTSPVFFLFLPLVLILYLLLPGKARMPLLLTASYLFYAYYDVRLLALIFITTLTSYFAGIAMSRSTALRGKKTAVCITVFVCLGILFFFKYFNFTVEIACSLLHLAGIHIPFEGFSILLPMGISFYIFQTMSYCFDVYSGKIMAEKNLGFYALFVVFFPQLVAGPIERPGDLLPRLKRTPSPARADMEEGFRLFIQGYAKKLLIADTIAPFVNAAYSDIPDAGGAALLAATVLFAIQIYCDFSGYSDIASGCARFLGIHLTENFKYPYQAVSIRDFWGRWHISLTRWLRDYLYIPLGGNRKGIFRQCVNILLTFLISGLWHGANLTYVIWGCIHGFYLILETLFWRKKTLPDKWRLPGRFFTFSLVSFAWIFFRAPSVSAALLVISSIFTDFSLQHLLQGLGASPTQLLILLVIILLLPFLEKLPSLDIFSAPGKLPAPDKPSAPKEYRMPGNRQIGILFFYFVLILVIILSRILSLTTDGATTFIYFQF